MTVYVSNFELEYLSSTISVFRNLAQVELEKLCAMCTQLNGLRQANLVLIAYASSEGSGEPAHPRSLARTFAARSCKQ